MQGKARFWSGLAGCVAGVVVTVLADGRVAMHLIGAITVLAGVLVAVRNIHAGRIDRRP